MAAYAAAHLDKIEEHDEAGSHYQPIRRHLGLTAFGVTAWTGRTAGDLVIREHDEDETTADQELFLVLGRHAEFQIKGDRWTRHPNHPSSPLPARSEWRPRRRQRP